MKREIFTTETGLKAEATFDADGYCIKYRLISKVPKGWYYSCLNEIGEYAEQHFKFKI